MGTFRGGVQEWCECVVLVKHKMMINEDQFQAQKVQGSEDPGLTASRRRGLTRGGVRGRQRGVARSGEGEGEVTRGVLCVCVWVVCFAREEGVCVCEESSGRRYYQVLQGIRQHERQVKRTGGKRCLSARSVWRECGCQATTIVVMLVR